MLQSSTTLSLEHPQTDIPVLLAKRFLLQRYTLSLLCKTKCKNEIYALFQCRTKSIWKIQKQVFTSEIPNNLCLEHLYTFTLELLSERIFPRKFSSNFSKNVVLLVKRFHLIDIPIIPYLHQNTNFYIKKTSSSPHLYKQIAFFLCDLIPPCRSTSCGFVQPIATLNGSSMCSGIHLALVLSHLLGSSYLGSLYFVS